MLKIIKGGKNKKVKPVFGNTSFQVFNILANVAANAGPIFG